MATPRSPRQRLEKALGTVAIALAVIGFLGFLFLLIATAKNLNLGAATCCYAGGSTLSPEQITPWLLLVGAFTFGTVVGWVTYRTLRHTTEVSQVGDIAAVLAAVGGAAVTALFPAATGAFGAYCIGLAIGFFGYVIVGARVAPNVGWLGPTVSRDSTSARERNRQLEPTARPEPIDEPKQ
jgi:hypothetical protein